MRRFLIIGLIVAGLVGDAAAQQRPAAPAKPEGEMRWALYVTLAPAWFDPGENSGGFLTPFWVLYALHDALVKPMVPVVGSTRGRATQGEVTGGNHADRRFPDPHLAERQDERPPSPDPDVFGR